MRQSAAFRRSLEQAADDGTRGNRSIKIIRTTNQADYRKQLYQAFETSQRDYLERLRKRGRETQPLQAKVTSASPPDQLKTCEPAAPKFTDMPRKLIKFGGALKLQKTRYFLVDQANILYFTK